MYETNLKTNQQKDINQDLIINQEELLSSLPDVVKERYFFEINGIDNELADLKNEHYYERLQRLGVPLISTIGDHLQYRITLLQNAVENNQPGFLE